SASSAGSCRPNSYWTATRSWTRAGSSSPPDRSHSRVRSPAEAAMAEDALPELISKLRRVPDDARDFSVSRDFALHDYRLPAELLDWVFHDAPTTENAGQLFDSADLRTLGLH